MLSWWDSAHWPTQPPLLFIYSFIYSLTPLFVYSTCIFLKSPWPTSISLPLHRQQCSFLFPILMFFICFSPNSSLFETLNSFIGICSCKILYVFCKFFFPVLWHFPLGLLPFSCQFAEVLCVCQIVVPCWPQPRYLQSINILIFGIILPRYNQNQLYLSYGFYI